MIAVVLPTIRFIDTWLEAWADQFGEHDIVLYVIEDRDQKEIKIPYEKYLFEIHHYSRAEIKKELGKDAWIIPTFNSGIRSFGFWKAWQDGATQVITLDDDCLPLGGNEIGQHISTLNHSVPISWFNTLKHKYPRGFPYLIRKEAQVVLNHGVWNNVLDLDAPTQLQTLGESEYPAFQSEVVPKGAYFPMCIMNLSFEAWLAPIMYQFLMGKDWPYDRFDDIWSGIVIKKILDHLNLAVTTGSPVIDHSRASDVFENLKKEAAGIGTNETFWQAVDAVELTADSIAGAYKELWEKIDLDDEYFKTMKKAVKVWLKLFEKKA